MLERAWLVIRNSIAHFINGIIALANHLPFMNIPMIADAPQVPAHAMRSGGARGAQGGDVYIDGKKAGEILWPNIAANMTTAAARPNQGTSGFNSGWSLMRPATAR